MAEMKVPTVGAVIEAYGFTDVPNDDPFNQPAVTVEQDPSPMKPGPVRLVLNTEGIRAALDWIYAPAPASTLTREAAD